MSWSANCGGDNPEGLHTSEEGRKAGQRGFIICSNVFLTSRLTGSLECSLVFPQRYDKPSLSLQISKVFWDCKNAQGGMVNFNPSLLRLQSLTQPTSVPEPSQTFQLWPLVTPTQVLLNKRKTLTHISNTKNTPLPAMSPGSVDGLKLSVSCWQV